MEKQYILGNPESFARINRIRDLIENTPEVIVIENPIDALMENMVKQLKNGGIIKSENTEKYTTKELLDIMMS